MWRGLAERAAGICEAARDDPYEPRLAEEIRALAGELAVLNAGDAAGSTTLQPDERAHRATAHAAVGEAWFALLDSKQALVEFDTALEVLGDDGSRSPACAAAQAQALCGRGKCLVDLRRSAEAVPVLDASIDWYLNHGDSSDEAQQSLLSQALHTLGLAHADAGNHEMALDATARAVALRRRLAERDVRRYRLPLSRSLRNLGNWLNELGRSDEALQSRREMLELRREQHRGEPSVAAALALAQAADTLARELVERRRELDDAVDLAKDSSRLYLELAQTRSGEFAPSLTGRSLCELSAALEQAGRKDEALKLAEEAALLLLKIAKADRASGLPRLAETLVTLCLSLASRSNPEGMIMAAATAETHRDLRAAGRETFAPGLADVFGKLCVSFGHLGHHGAALVSGEHAIQLYSELATQDPDKFLYPLAESTRNVSVALRLLNQKDATFAASSSAVALLRELADRDRATYVEDLMRGLNEMARDHEALERNTEGAQARREAITLLRELASRSRARYLPELARCLGDLGVELARSGHTPDAAACAEESVNVYRELLASGPTQHAQGLVRNLRNLGVLYKRLGRETDALDAIQESAWLGRGVAAANPRELLPEVAKSLADACKMLADLGRRTESVDAQCQEVEVYRQLALVDRSRHLADLATCLGRAAGTLGEAGEQEEALRLASESVEVFRRLAAEDREAHLQQLATSALRLSVRLMAAGRSDDALASAREAVALHQEAALSDHGARLPRVATSLENLCNQLGDRGNYAEALRAAQEVVELRRELASQGEDQSLCKLAAAFHALSLRHAVLGQNEEALRAAVEDVVILRNLAAKGQTDSQARLPDSMIASRLAGSLVSLGAMFDNLGRRSDALAATEEAVQLYRSLARDKPGAFTHGLATSLSNLGAMSSNLGRRDAALVATREAVKLYRRLTRDEPGAFGAGLPRSLSNLGEILDDLGSHDEALAVAEEAVQLYRTAARSNPLTCTPDLASSLSNLGLRLSKVGRHSDALAATEEAVQLHRRLVAKNCEVFGADLARGLNNLGIELSDLGRREESLAAYRECGAWVLQLRPDDPNRWCRLCRGAVCWLEMPQDLRDFHLPLLVRLTEYRELAWSSEHAAVFLDLQAQVVARVWELLATLPTDEGDLLDEAVSALVATLHSPDLARWLEARGSGDGPLAKLAELKRMVMEAEQPLTALRKGLPGDDNSGWRADSSGPGTVAQRDALFDVIGRQSAVAQALRQAFRNERARLVTADPRFAAAFEPVGAQALRSIAGHAHGGALLCVLELGSVGTAGQPEPSSSERSRCVAALLHADGRRTQLLELQGLSELTWHAQNYRPEALGDSRRGPLRGAPAGAPRLAFDDASTPPITDLLAPRMSQSFWTPLQQALRASGVAVERLHVCLHGPMQQLPLAMRQAGDCPGLQVIAWPGLPYLRRAAMATSAKSESHSGTDASAPWLVGHDCAWGSEQPLPMVAMEAALLRDLLQRHGQQVQQFRLAAQLHGRATALVACCHGGAEQAQFDHALHLGQQPLTVRQIVQENIGPPLALLPACHAGRTDEDAAGNALGVAAAFMLSGTQVVVASSKAVPDLLQPWLSTLTVWHAMQGLPHHEAATLAREQFARLEFPEDYRRWLQQALPQALAPIQPGGEEDQHIRGVHAQAALEQVEARWPWEGDTKDLFSADPARREEATRSVVQGIVQPRGDEAGASALATEAREMAAFVVVYGVARNGASRGIAAGTATSAEPTHAARPGSHAAQPRPPAELAPSTPQMARNLTTPPVPDQPEAKPPASGLLGRLRSLIGR